MSSISNISTATVTPPALLRATSVQLPGAAPKSKTELPFLKILNFSSI